jgi:hypothetical protein
MPATLTRSTSAKKTRRAIARPKTAGPTYARVSDAAVTKATGKPWSHWLTILDRYDVKKHGHKDAAEHLHEKHSVPEWWCQMVVVGYEQARGLRVKHQTTSGFQVSVSRVINRPIGEVFKAWQPPAISRWMPDPDFVVRKATKDRSIRITWIDGKTSVEVMFYVKGPAKCSVTAQHNKLSTAAAGEKMKRYWGKALDALKAMLED